MPGSLSGTSSARLRGDAGSELAPVKPSPLEAEPQLPYFVLGLLPGSSSAKEPVSFTSLPRAFDSHVCRKEKG